MRFRVRFNERNRVNMKLDNIEFPTISVEDSARLMKEFTEGR